VGEMKEFIRDHVGRAQISCGYNGSPKISDTITNRNRARKIGPRMIDRFGKQVGRSPLQ